MRIPTSFRLLLVPAAIVAAACEDSSSPLEAPVTETPALEAEAPAVAEQRWADGYAFANNPAATSYTPPADYSYNRAGGRISIQRPGTGRFIITFAGLSAALGSKSTVHVTSVGGLAIHCKPMTAALVADKVEVRCLGISNGAPSNSAFTIVVLRKAAARAFAFAHKPTTASYAPAGSGSYNPAGTMRINRLTTGNYQVLFNNLGAQLAAQGGHMQVNAVASGKAWCKTAEEWRGNPHLSVLVQCYTTGGVPVDAKFTVLFLLPTAHLGYAYASQPTVGSYKAEPFWSVNPAGGQVTVSRFNQGEFIVNWSGADAQILGQGNVQVTALGFYDNSYCNLTDVRAEGAFVRCFAANGTSVDVPFTILLGS